MTKVIETFPEVEELIKTYKKETLIQKTLQMVQDTRDEDWIVNESHSDCRTKHCFLGWLDHWGMLGNGVNSDARSFLGRPPYEVNNGLDKRYSQPTPRQRMIAVLQDMIKAGY